MGQSWTKAAQSEAARISHQLLDFAQADVAWAHERAGDSIALVGIHARSREAFAPLADYARDAVDDLRCVGPRQPEATTAGLAASVWLRRIGRMR